MRGRARASPQRDGGAIGEIIGVTQRDRPVALNPEELGG
jgi:hypothetical protein